MSEDHQDLGMGDLIPIRQEGDSLWADARMLHLALGVSTRFSDWMTRRLIDTLAEEGKEFYSDLSKTPEGGRPTIIYTISLDLAKEIAMLERTERGKAIRRYFIESERRLRMTLASQPSSQAPVLPTDPLELLALSLRSLQLQRGQIRELQDGVQAIEKRLDNTPISMDSGKLSEISRLCKSLARVHPNAWPGAYRSFKEAMGQPGVPLARYDALPIRRYDEALRWLELQIQSFQAARPLSEHWDKS